MKRRDIPADPAAEREQLRQLTRELHEAAQDARDAARQLRAERAEAAQLIGDQAVSLVNPIIEEMNRQIRQGEEELVAQMQQIEDLITEKFAAILGLANFAEAKQFVADTITGQMNRPEYTDAIARGVLARMTAAQASAGRGRVMVATAEALQEYQAAGGDPGLVIDLREQRVLAPRGRGGPAVARDDGPAPALAGGDQALIAQRAQCLSDRVGRHAVLLGADAGSRRQPAGQLPGEDRLAQHVAQLHPRGLPGVPVDHLHGHDRNSACIRHCSQPNAWLRMRNLEQQ